MNAAITNKLNIFIALLVITAAQIGLSYVGFLAPAGHIIAALLLAASETILVGLFFMGLKNDDRLLRTTALFPFVLFCIMNGAVVLDVLIFMKH
ncbi:MAG TPA: cytochrome C oxidase subunit IV family protein [bacterium]|nr:cytochrome C oxidase subunit IV family protein [bacterium]